MAISITPSGAGLFPPTVWCLCEGVWPSRCSKRCSAASTYYLELACVSSGRGLELPNASRSAGSVIKHADSRALALSYSKSSAFGKASARSPSAWLGQAIADAAGSPATKPTLVSQRRRLGGAAPTDSMAPAGSQCYTDASAYLEPPGEL